MKRALLMGVLLCAGAGYVYLQTVEPARKAAELMPAGAVLCLESPDFGRLLREWNASPVKAAWLESDNYEAFTHSNLAIKLQEVYGQYAAAAGFVPGLKSAMEIAGTESALALYEIREVEFLYLSRIGEAELARSQLWAVRDKFEQRQAGGVTFYLRTDAASKRTVAFALAHGWLLVATRDDLVAQALELMAGGTRPSLASTRWYRPAAAAQSPGELRLTMNLEALLGSVAFRSYWVQRNVSSLRGYWAGVADVRRAAGSIAETRVFLKTPDAPAPAAGIVNPLAALAPDEAGLYKAWRLANADEGAELIVRRLMAPAAQHARDRRLAPYEAFLDVRAGSEADLEQRIDEPPLRMNGEAAQRAEAVRKLVEAAGADQALLVESSAAEGETFVRMHAAVVLAAQRDWNAAEARAVLGPLPAAVRGKLLLVANDAALLASVLNRAGVRPAAGRWTYAAAFRHARERANYARIMTALDFGHENGPAFFSGNLGSLSEVLSGIGEVVVTEEERTDATLQTVVYR